MAAKELLRNRKINEKLEEKNSRIANEKNLAERHLKDEKDFKDRLSLLVPEKNSYYLTRIVLVRYLAFIYFVAFLIALNQNQHLLGSNGLKPANKYMEKIFKDDSASKSESKDLKEDLKKKFDLFLKCPTIFWFFDWSNKIDDLLKKTSLIGITISFFILIMGQANSILMFILWILYHSLINVGQTWYSFGWESQLLESGFIGIFLVPFFSFESTNAKSPPSYVSILLFRWLIIRIMLGAGLIKIRGDKCWMDLTCMNYHYETQPVPNPISYYMHKEPEFFHKFEVLSNHFIELIAPLMILIPFRRMRIIGGLIQIKFQILLIISGNLSFLNWLTILPSLACFDDYFYQILFNRQENSTLHKLLRNQFLKKIEYSALNLELSKLSNKIKRRFRITIDLLLLALVGYLSMPVVLNLLSSKQAMNTSFEPFRIVNTYGAFGSITKERYEVIFLGTQSLNLNDKNQTKWLEYEFKCKPGNIFRKPCIISPYHYRLDWLMWFAAFQSYEYNPWLLSLSAKFLLNDKNFTNSMIAYNPFQNSEPPKYIKADLYLYKYTKLESNTSAWWRRKYIRSYLPTITFDHLKTYVDQLGWTYNF